MFPISKTVQLRFDREISVLRQLRHPRLVSVLNAGCDRFGSWFVMEYAAAGDLHRWLKNRRSPVTPAKALKIVDQILEALAFLHRLPLPLDVPDANREVRTIVHRDVKPGNILLVDKQANAVKLADFGFAKAHELAGYSAITGSNVRGGTCWFVARSLAGQFRDAPPTADLWSATATLFFLLTGQPPRKFEAASDEWQVVLRRKARPIRKLRPDVPAKLAAVIDGALLDKPTSQLGSASKLRAALRRAAEAAGIDINWST